MLMPCSRTYTTNISVRLSSAEVDSVFTEGFSVLTTYYTLQTQKQFIFSDAYNVEKKRREGYEKQQNQEIIRTNVTKIINNCINVANNVSVEVGEVLNEICKCLQQLDLTLINSNDLIASGILDICEGADNVMDTLPTKTKQVLTNFKLSEQEFPKDVKTMLDEFINIYDPQNSNSDPALAGPITFPQNESNLSIRRTLLTTFDLLEGLRNCWNLTPSLTEGEYSETSYTIHSVSRIIDPIFNYYNLKLKRSWEQVSNSSRDRKESMGSIHYGDRPDFQILLILDSIEWESVFAEISRLDPRPDKQDHDWKKLNRLCKDGFDARFNELFKGKDVENNETKCLINELHQFPFIGIQVIDNRILVFGIDYYNNSFYRSFKICEFYIPLTISNYQVVENFLKSSLKVKYYLEGLFNDFVRIKDKIDRLPTIVEVVEDEKSQSFMSLSTTY
ncbi:uncharacterized protein OCT59_002083 [Rhizophagus irregularis]|uniref:uncharacterized protein n=1 Tax=Rhizophagus irregularis TaxID=588596 RepID=UPI0033191285|nr:hypothetical protein OCT59_002083 [Rhizophagus irregularis]